MHRYHSLNLLAASETHFFFRVFLFFHVNLPVGAMWSLPGQDYTDIFG